MKWDGMIDKLVDGPTGQVFSPSPNRQPPATSIVQLSIVPSTSSTVPYPNISLSCRDSACLRFPAVEQLYTDDLEFHDTSVFGCFFTRSGHGVMIQDLACIVSSTVTNALAENGSPVYNLAARSLLGRWRLQLKTQRMRRLALYTYILPIY